MGSGKLLKRMLSVSGNLAFKIRQPPRLRFPYAHRPMPRYPEFTTEQISRSLPQSLLG